MHNIIFIIITNCLHTTFTCIIVFLAEETIKKSLDNYDKL